MYLFESHTLFPKYTNLCGTQWGCKNILEAMTDFVLVFFCYFNLNSSFSFHQQFEKTKDEKLKNQQREYEAQKQYREHLQV